MSERSRLSWLLGSLAVVAGMLAWGGVGDDSTVAARRAPGSPPEASSATTDARSPWLGPKIPSDGVVLGGPGCSPASPLIRELRGPNGRLTPELKGTTATGSLWGFVFAESWPPAAGARVKIVWRMTGAGPLSIAVTAPDGAEAPPFSGPTEHGASTYDRPGDEWGSLFVFDQPGCWEIHLERDDTSGSVWVLIT